ncbi:MAG: V-type ATPase 116kDa subunit family protein [Candidatus Sedimenticola sp. 20ELBAFRAG]
MIKPLPMKHVLLQVMTDDLPRVSLALADLGLFSPDHRPFEEENFPIIPGEHYRELFHQASSRLEKIRKNIPLTGQPELEEIHVVNEQELERYNNWLGTVWERCSEFEETFRELTSEERMIDQLDQALDNFTALNIDLSLIHGDKHFLDIHLGMVPRENIPQLTDAVSLAGYMLFVYMKHGDNRHVIILGPKGTQEKEIVSVLDTAGFRPLPVPAELQDEPEKVRQDLHERKQNVLKERAHQQAEMAACGDELRVELETAQRILIMAEPFVTLETAARSSGRLTVISGWIPARAIKRTRKALTKELANPFCLEERDPLKEERHLVPSYLPTGRMTSPFHTLVKQYGIPRYGEVDPTILFSITFVAMFGMMFGDIGHGVTIMLVAFLARKKLKSFTLLGISAGASASLFGVLYGSIFGYEELFHAVWIPPLSDPLYMLTAALLWGIGFLTMITLISIHNRLIEGDISRAIFDTNGLVSILLYLSVLGGVYSLYSTGRFGIPAAILSVGSLLALLAYKLIETHAPPGERMLVAFIETFETLTGYISNTLSFLRVAAFSLNHVALAIAVFTLADMMDTTGHWLTVIGGNIFILVLEGAIVTIQVLRLEYYEGFSRFFSGDGLEFKPLKLNNRSTA